jgi:hypothetical protein
MPYSDSAVIRAPKTGDCVVGREGDDIVIWRADPVTQITHTMVEEIRAGNCRPEITLEGDILTINAVNRRVVYRIYWDTFDGYNYVMQWPD